jgi:adenylylsulfate kinase-like enzyme
MRYTCVVWFTGLSGAGKSTIANPVEKKLHGLGPPKARRGELQNFTGMDSPYEPPEQPEVRVDTTVATPEDAAGLIVAHLRSAGVLDPT